MTYESLINFINFLKQISLIAIGAVIPMVSSYFFNNRRERSIVKIHIQANAAEEVLKNIKEYSENLQKITFNISNVLIRYNLYTKLVKELKNTNEIDIYEVNILNEIFKDVEEYKYLYNEYNKAFIKLIINLETDEVIFNKMIGYKDLLSVENDNINKIYINITNLYYVEIYDDILKINAIDEKTILLLKEYEDKFEAKKKDIINHVTDLRVSIQNEFFRKMFRYKVPYREQLPGEVPVHKVGFKYSQINNK